MLPSNESAVKFDSPRRFLTALHIATCMINEMGATGVFFFLASWFHNFPTRGIIDGATHFLSSALVKADL